MAFIRDDLKYWNQNVKTIDEYKEVFRMASQKYKKKDFIKEYYNIIHKDKKYEEIEQELADIIFAPVIDVMGDERVWRLFLADEINIQGVESKRGSKGFDKIAKTDEAWYNGGHWRSRNKGETLWFDPYDSFQVKGSNQFCQTFSLMKLCGALPDIYEKKNVSDPLDKYYYYSKCAISFIEEVLKTVSTKLNNKKEKFKGKAELKKEISACTKLLAIWKKYPEITLNIIIERDMIKHGI